MAVRADADHSHRPSSRRWELTTSRTGGRDRALGLGRIPNARWVTRAGAVVGVVAVAAALAPAPAALARAPKRDKSVMVVEVVNRAPYGDMLATVGGASLYTTAGSCTGSCLTIWPPLVLPKGKKIPTGVSGLGKLRLAHHRPQITYDGRRLYTFYADSGGDVTGNGVGGFVVATTP
jgi:predicted lipoprotein with Yx(FWY)xxD motif